MSKFSSTIKIVGTLGAVALLAACASPAQDAPAETEQATGALAGEQFVVAVSEDEVPFGYLDETGAFVGVTADLLEALSAKLGFSYETEATDFAAAIPGVQSGKYDFAFRQMGITEERIETLDLVSWKKDGVTFEKLATNPIEIHDDFTGLCGLTVGILNGEAQSEATLTTVSDECVAAGEAAITISPFADRATADLAVLSERVDLATNSAGMFGYLQQQQPGVYEATGPVFNPVYQGLGFPDGSELAEVIRDALNELIADGTYQQILKAHGVESIGVTESEIDILA
jgi:polar amino acid transport system substrate-binding protein